MSNHCHRLEYELSTMYARQRSAVNSPSFLQRRSMSAGQPGWMLCRSTAVEIRWTILLPTFLRCTPSQGTRSRSNWTETWCRSTLRRRRKRWKCFADILETQHHSYTAIWLVINNWWVTWHITPYELGNGELVIIIVKNWREKAPHTW